MKRMILSAVFVVAGVGAGVASAHDTGHESRTVQQCEKLTGTATTGDRAACLACVQRKEKHHYHPDYPPGKRCRPDNGKP